MRFPKTVQICGKAYTVKRDKTYDGGTGRTIAQTITIGTKASQERIFETLVHEITELVCIENGVRYNTGSNIGSDGTIFVMSHKEFDKVSVDVATALQPLMIKDVKNDPRRLRQKNKKR